MVSTLRPLGFLLARPPASPHPVWLLTRGRTIGHFSADHQGRHVGGSAVQGQVGHRCPRVVGRGAARAVWLECMGPMGRLSFGSNGCAWACRMRRVTWCSGWGGRRSGLSRARRYRVCCNSVEMRSLSCYFMCVVFCAREWSRSDGARERASDAGARETEVPSLSLSLSLHGPCRCVRSRHAGRR